MHELYADPEVRAAVVERWGPDVAPAGTVDRAAVARRAFAEPDERAWLERLLWPRVGARVAAWRATEAARTPPPRALVVETPLLFEAGLADRYDATLVVIADEGIRAERAAARGHARSTSAPHASSPRTRRRRAPTTSSATTAIWRVGA